MGGESWLGLENLHRLTSERSYSLRVTMTDYDGAWYTAVYDRFKVGPGGTYVLTLEGFNSFESTLGDSLLAPHSLNGMKFTTKDRDQDNYDSTNCGQLYRSGWWHRRCTQGQPTGLQASTKTHGTKYITWYQSGARGEDNTWDSW